MCLRASMYDRDFPFHQEYSGLLPFPMGYRMAFGDFQPFLAHRKYSRDGFPVCLSIWDLYTFENCQAFSILRAS